MSRKEKIVLSIFIFILSVIGSSFGFFLSWNLYPNYKSANSEDLNVKKINVEKVNVTEDLQVNSFDKSYVTGSILKMEGDELLLTIDNLYAYNVQDEVVLKINANTKFFTTSLKDGDLLKKEMSEVNTENFSGTYPKPYIENQVDSRDAFISGKNVAVSFIGNIEATTTNAIAISISLIP
ncbi:MAG: hypothetical protein K9M10_02895 [Candidatus Pacebacteria bacterium]|nr:hypothetical protein [Candidatus Paceibacterota bacterium]MCF7857400.1 hypothetical protein [Candidatus Paceibacterota bacterium]